jgi:hypothetical protein
MQQGWDYHELNVEAEEKEARKIAARRARVAARIERFLDPRSRMYGVRTDRSISWGGREQQCAGGGWGR